ncbi:anthrone oxygenase family protein [Yoonia vestfoldensis]|uniref:anthrone oxygenase family protein n=1 Tax=Yoonia vestfoldensis TaxID=245188 RepID=UPI0003A02C59|nr:anthrone oxygenase family protein [Yoonia vestfoldensis]
MTSDPYRRRANALAVISSAAFFGANLFIGASMGVYWLRLAPSEFVAQFFPQFSNFLFTIMPLFLLMPVGLILSARCDWHVPAARRNWVIALWLYLAVSLITVFYHMPLNVRLAAAIGSPLGDALDFYKRIALSGPVTEANAAAMRALWLLGHIPRVLITLAIPVYVLRAMAARQSDQS